MKTGEDLSLEHAKQNAAELSLLAAAQHDALQKPPYLLMSRVDREVYDRRRAQIAKLTEWLAMLRPKESDAADLDIQRTSHHGVTGPVALSVG